MADQTDVQLKAAATQIKNETTVGANTASRMGTLLENMTDNKLHKGVQVVMTTTVGRQIVPHSMGKRPQQVTFFNNDEQLLMEWYRTDGGSGCDPLNNIVLHADQIYSNLEINFL